jgi:hypothetical protein
MIIEYYIYHLQVLCEGQEFSGPIFSMEFAVLDDIIGWVADPSDQKPQRDPHTSQNSPWRTQHDQNIEYSV